MNDGGKNGRENAGRENDKRVQKYLSYTPADIYDDGIGRVPTVKQTGKKLPDYAAEKSEIRLVGKKGTRWHFYARGVDLVFVWIEPGRFKTKTDKGISRIVEITDGFWLMETQTTVEAFEAFSQATGYVVPKGACGYDEQTRRFKFDEKYTYKNPGFHNFLLGANYPATCVDWAGANAFCSWLNEEFCDKLEPWGRQKRRRLCFRLPTEAEWELACRAGSSKAYSVGGNPNDLQEFGNFDEGGKRDGYNELAPTKSFYPNVYRLYDMHGNVWEWCADWYAPYKKKVWFGAEKNPNGPASGMERVMRGGSWNSSARVCRSASRGSAPPWSRDVRIGFRVALTFLPEEKLSKFLKIFPCRCDKNGLNDCNQWCWRRRQGGKK